PQIRQYVMELLSAHYDVRAEAEASAALKSASALAPNLVLANVTTLAMDGFDVLRELRQDLRMKPAPIILYSDPAGEELCVEGMEAGADDCVIAPFSKRLLLARIRAQMHAARMRDESMQAVRASEERHRTLVNAMNTAVWSAAPNGDIVGEAHGWEKITGQTAEEYRGFGWMAVVHPDDKPRVLKIWQRCLTD